jgi:hypothetical protein
MAMQTRRYITGRKLLWLMAAVGVSLCVAFALLLASRKAASPKAPLVSGCKSLEPGSKRIGERYSFQFDVPAKDFTVWKLTEDEDTALLSHRYSLKPKNGAHIMNVSFGQVPMQSMALDPARIISRHVEKRVVADSEGNVVGEDYWGYIDSSERWRQLRLRGGIVANYGFVTPVEAERFDRIISSVCLAPTLGS